MNEHIDKIECYYIESSNDFNKIEQYTIEIETPDTIEYYSDLEYRFLKYLVDKYRSKEKSNDVC